MQKDDGTGGDVGLGGVLEGHLQSGGVARWLPVHRMDHPPSIPSQRQRLPAPISRVVLVFASTRKSFPPSVHFSCLCPLARGGTIDCAGQPAGASLTCGYQPSSPPPRRGELGAGSSRSRQTSVFHHLNPPCLTFGIRLRPRRDEHHLFRRPRHPHAPQRGDRDPHRGQLGQLLNRHHHHARAAWRSTQRHLDIANYTTLV